MDNFKIDVISEGKEAFTLALKIALSRYSKVTHYYVDAKRGMVLYWTDPKETGVTKLPFDMKLEHAVDFVWGWLQEGADFGAQPDHDGDNGKGFRVSTDSWGRVANVPGEFYTIAAIQPVWAMYGK